MHVGSFHVEMTLQHETVRTEKKMLSNRSKVMLKTKNKYTKHYSPTLNSSPVGGSGAPTAAYEPSLNTGREEERNHG